MSEQISAVNLSTAVLPHDHISRLTNANGFADGDMGNKKEKLNLHRATRSKGDIEKQTENTKQQTFWYFV